MNHQATALSKTQSPVPPTLYSPRDLAQLIGVSLRTVRSWIRSGDLAHTRLGPGERLIRVRHEDLEAFLDRRHHESCIEQ